MDENRFNQPGGQENIPPQEQVPPPYTAAQQQPVYDARPVQPQQDMNGAQGGAPSAQPQKPKKKRGAWKIVLPLVAGVVAGCLLMAFVVFPLVAGQKNYMQLPSKEEVQQDQGTGETPKLGSDEGGITSTDEPAVQIAENISPSVVGITAYEKQLVSGQEPIEQALDAGTGFVISEDGYILTNNHVVANGNLIKVTTSDNQEHVAQKIGGDSATDIAVLKVDGLGIKAVPVGDSDFVKAGELAVAIGNIHGEKFSNSVTVGHVSITSQEVIVDGNKMDMIQTDAAINPGNSGGPLIGSDGKVIGVTSAKKFYSGMDADGNLLSSEGVGYAIPINKAIGIAEQLIENGSIPRAGIGITYTMISEVDAKLWQTPRGALVADVTSGGPADQAGIQQNDVITELDGVDLTNGTDMPILSQKAVGETINAKVWREGKEYTVELTLADMNSIG